MAKTALVLLVIPLLMGMVSATSTSIPANSLNLRMQTTTYAPITADSLPDLQLIAQFSCGDDTFTPQGAALLGSELLFSCNAPDTPFAIADIASDEAQWTFDAESGLVLQLAWLDDGQAILADTQTELIRVDRESRQITHRIAKANFTTFALSPDGTLVAFVTEAELPDQPEGRKVIIASTDTLAPDSSFVYPVSGSPALAFGVQNETLLLAIGRTNGVIALFDLTNNSPLYPIEQTPFRFQERYSALTFTPDGAGLLVSQCTYAQGGCTEGGLSRINVNSGITQQVALHRDTFSNMVYSSDGSLIFALQASHLLFLDAETLSEVTPPIAMPSSGDMYQLAVSPDGTLLAVLENRDHFNIYGIVP